MKARSWWMTLAMVLPVAASARDQCTPFDLDPALAATVSNGRFPDGGPAPDSSLCCKQGVACKRRCQPKSAVSEPVDTISGFAWLDRSDLQVQQPWGPDFAFARHYSTAMAELAAGTALGPGWTHTYALTLTVSGAGPAARVRLDESDSAGEEYNWMGGGGYASMRGGTTLTWDGTLHLYLAGRGDGSLLVFDEAGRLKVMRAADGGEAQLRYGGEVACPVSATVPAGALCRVDFLFGRQLFFAYDAGGHLAQVSHDAAGTAPVVALAYDGAGRLASAAQADGRAESYAYGMDHVSWAAGVPVSLLLSATDGDGVVVESFGYAFNHTALDGPARVVTHQTPEAAYTFSWDYLSADNQVVRQTRVRGTQENLDLTFRDNALATVCEVDAQGTCDLTQLQEFVQAPGLLDDLCERESSGFYTRHERDSLGRVVAEYTGLTACEAVTPEARQHGVTLGYAGTSSRSVSNAFASVDSTAPAGFQAFLVSDFSAPASQVDPYCGADACQRPDAYNQGALSTTVQREVRVGRTLVDTDGAWGTQVQVTTFTRDASGRLTSVDGPRRDVADVSSWSWSPTLAWAMTSSTESGHGPVQYADHDRLGRARTLTSENGQVERLETDPLGRLTSRLEAGRGVPTTWSYTDGGRPDGFLEPAGPAVRFEYAAGLLAAEKRFPGPAATAPDTTLALGYAGNHLVTQTSSTGLVPTRSWTHAYDTQGRPFATTPLGSTHGRALGRDGDGRVRWQSDRGAYDGTSTPPQSHRYAYDPYGELARVERLLQGSWVTVRAFTRDSQGRPTSATDARGITTHFVHDDFGRLVELSSPDLGLRRYVYDEGGNVVKERRGDGTVLSYRHDAAGRLVEVAVGGAVLETREVATAAPGVTDCAGGAALPAPLSLGEVTHVHDASGDWYFGFWPDGKLRYEGRVAPGSGCARTFWWEHDTAGRLTAEVYPSGARIELGYPAVGQPFPDLPTSLTLAAGGQRSPLLTQLTFTEGELTGYQTAAGRWSLTRRTDGTPSSLTVLAGGLREQSFSGVDAWGNPSSIQERIDDQHTAAELQTLAHDGLPTLTAASGPGHLPQTFSSLATRDRKSSGGVPYCYEAGTHRLSRVGGTMSLRHDPNGAAWQQRLADGSLRTWCYGPQGELRSTVGTGGDVSDLVANFRGQRTTERWPLVGLQEDFRVDSASRLRVESGVASLTALYPRPTREYVWVGKRPVAVVESTEAADGTVTPAGVTLLFSGQLGEVLAETDESGQRLRQYALSPYGERVELPPPSAERPVTVNLLSLPPLDGLMGTVQATGARALRLHFLDAAWAGCHVTARDGATAAWVGEWPQVQAGDLTPWLPSSEVALTLTGCSPPARVAAGVQGEVGPVTVQARSEHTTAPYPAAGQQFHLSMPGPGYLHFTGVALASCDRLEARGPGGAVLWAWKPTGYSVSGFLVPDTEGFSGRLEGEVDVGIWGAGCNGTEAKAGFTLAQLRLDASAALRPPVSITLPGQKVRADGSVDNWHRLYLPELGRYLQPEPLAEFSAAVASTDPLYAYARQTPLSATDPTGLYGTLSGCSTWSTALQNARNAVGCKNKKTTSCKCQGKLKDCKVCDLCTILSDEYPLRTALVDGLQCAGELAGGCTHVTTQKPLRKDEFVEFSSHLCYPDQAVTDNLSRAQIHEAVHACAKFAGHRFPDPPKGSVTPDKTKDCSPDAIAEACFPTPKVPNPFDDFPAD